MPRNNCWKLGSTISVALTLALSGLACPIAYAQSSPSIIDDISSTAPSATQPSSTAPSHAQAAHTLNADGDITEELQAALNKAAEEHTGVALEPGKSYSISNRISIPNGLAFLEGNGVEIAVNIPTTKKEEITSAFEFARGASNVVVNNFTMDLKKQEFTGGFSGDGISDATISHITMKNVEYRGIALTANQGPLRNITIDGNTIENAPGDINRAGHSLSITINAKRDEPDETFKASPSPIWDRYVTDGTVAPNTHEVTGIKVTNNDIHGGYYGISFSGVSASTITGNTITANTRNISLQNNSSDNTVENNRLSNSISSAIHIAYNSDNNQIKGNTITTSKSRGQGMLQAYQASDGNVFTNNIVSLEGDAHPSWILYVGTDSHNTVFDGNTVSGKVTHAIVGIESVWDAESARDTDSDAHETNTLAYMGHDGINSPVNGEKVTYGGGHGELRGITVRNNAITPKNKNAPVFYVGADVSKGKDGSKQIVGDIVDLNISGNEITGDEYSELVVTHEGSLPGVGQATIKYSDDSITR